MISYTSLINKIIEKVDFVDNDLVELALINAIDKRDTYW